MKTIVFIHLLAMLYGLFPDQPYTARLFPGSYDNCLRQAKVEQKPVLVLFDASWCTPCRHATARLLNDEKLAEMLNENFLIYSVHIDTADGAAIAKRFAIELIPAMVLLNSRGHEIKTFKGSYSSLFFRKHLERINQTELLYE